MAEVDILDQESDDDFPTPTKFHTITCKLCGKKEEVPSSWYYSCYACKKRTKWKENSDHLWDTWGSSETSAGDKINSIRKHTKCKA